MATKPRRVDGADLSHHNPDPNLARAKEVGLRFLYHKATEGDSFKDSTYNERRQAAAKAGVPFGAYHFARPGRGDARAEARFFLNYADPKPGDLLPCLDLEVDGGLSAQALQNWAATFGDVVRRRLGVEQVLYGPYTLDGPWVRWVPRYNNSNIPPTQPWDVWQFSNGYYGVPNRFDGLGAADLNTFRKGMTLGKLRIPRPTETYPVKAFHASMQFSDPTDKQARDAHRLFRKAREDAVWWVTGTEAGNASELSDLLKAEANANGFRYYRPGGTDGWIAVRRDVIQGGWDVHWEKVLDGKAGQYGNKGVVAVEFDSPVGHVTLITSHYLTRGRPTAIPKYQVNLEENALLAERIGQYAKQQGRGQALVFYGGDQNIVDRIDDTFFGQPLTSCWDELGRYENTGHGNIDVIASYDRDGRVECKDARAYDDSEFKMATDHFLVEAIYGIDPLTD